MNITIKGLDMPSPGEILVFDEWHGKMYARSTKDTGTKQYEVVEVNDFAVTEEAIKTVLDDPAVKLTDDVLFNPSKLRTWCADNGIDYEAFDRLYIKPLLDQQFAPNRFNPIRASILGF